MADLFPDSLLLLPPPPTSGPKKLTMVSTAQMCSSRHVHVIRPGNARSNTTDAADLPSMLGHQHGWGRQHED